MLLIKIKLGILVDVTKLNMLIKMLLIKMNITLNIITWLNINMIFLTKMNMI